MYGIALDVTDVLVCCSIVDALVDVVMNVFWWEVVAEIIVRSLVDFLVVTTVRLIDLMTLTSVPITTV
jgi:hypothetical protein